LKKIVLALFIIISIKLYSQESKYSVELNLPIQTGDSFINDNYSGIVDIGFRARFIKTNHVNIGFHLNGSLFKYKGTVRESTFKTLYVIQPKIYTELNTLNKIKPLLGIGYTLMTYRKTGNVDDGPNISLGLSYDITKKVFAQVQYDLIFGTSDYGTRFYNYDQPFPLPETLDSDNSILKIGIGYRL
jgi:hypothetical protein